MRITGGTDHIVRTYADDLTGVSLTVLVLFGPAEPVLPHTPEVCYPSSGFRLVDALGLGRSSSDGPGRAGASRSRARREFRSGVYQKAAGRAMLREEVYHSFRLDGQWSPDIGSGRKFPRRNPGVFKVQIQRQVADGGEPGPGGPDRAIPLGVAVRDRGGDQGRRGQEGGRRQVTGRPPSGFNGRRGSVPDLPGSEAPADHRRAWSRANGHTCRGGSARSRAAQPPGSPC